MPYTSAGDATAGSVAPVRGMRLNPITLAFAGEDAALERPFLDDYVRSSLAQWRVVLLLGAAFYGSFAILDHWLMPERQQAAWLIRFGVVCPAILLAAALTYLPSFGRIMQPVCSRPASRRARRNSSGATSACRRRRPNAGWPRTSASGCSNS